MKKIILALVILISTIKNSYSEEADSWKFSIGPGLVVKKNQRVNNQYSSMDKDITVRFIPFFEAKNRRFSLSANGMSYRVYGYFLSNISLSLNYDGDRYKTNGMSSRSSSFFTGLNFKHLNYSLNLTHDINNKSNGTIAKFDYKHMHIVSEKWMFITSVGLHWFDDRYANYYYGVKNSEKTAARRSYQLKNYVQPQVGILPIYRISKDFTATIGGFLKYIPNDVSHSPTMKGNQLEFASVWGISYNI